MATTDFWNGTGIWSTSNSDWSDNAPPQSTENAEIQTGTDTLVSTATIAALQIDAPAELLLKTSGTLVSTGTANVPGFMAFQNGGSASITGGLNITGSGAVVLDAPFIGGSGGDNLTISGTLTNSSSNGNALDIGNSGITAGDTVTAGALVNTGQINLAGAGTIQATLNITTGTAGFGTLGVETGSVYLANDALLDFASGQIGTIDGVLSLNGANARVADAGTLTTSSALTGLTAVSGSFDLQNGASVSTTGGLSITGSGVVGLDAPYIGGNGGSSLTIGGTLTNSSTSNSALDIGNTGITAGDTVTATGLVSTGEIQIAGSGTVQATLNITSGPASFGTVGVETGSVYLTNDALLDFASGQIGTVTGNVGLNGANARIADAGTLATNSALAGLTAVSGYFYLENGASVTTTQPLSITGSGAVALDAPYLGGNGGSSLTVGGTLTNSSTNSGALSIGNGGITSGETLTAAGLVNTGAIGIEGGNTIQATLNVTGPASFGTVGVETGSVYLTNDALLDFASGQIGTIAGLLSLNGANARVADAGTLATNSALNGVSAVSGSFYLQNGASVTTTGGLSVTGSGALALDSAYTGGRGGSSLTINGTLANSSTNSGAVYIGNGGISSGETVTATSLANTGAINIYGNGTTQATLNITSGPASFGTLGVETGSVVLTNDALLDFASGQIGTVDGLLSLNGANARVADAGTLATNSALTGLTAVSGYFYLQNGASLTTTQPLSITGSGAVALDAPYIGGGGGSSLTVGGTLTNSSTNGGALSIGNGSITSGDTLTATGLVNTGAISIEGSNTIQATLNITSGPASFGTVGVETGSVYLTNDALLDFASGQIGTIDGLVSLNGASARIADAGTLASNSALSGLNTDSGYFYLENGASVSTTGGLSVVGSGDLAVDSAYIGGGGGSSLTINGTLTNSSTNGGAVYIGNGSISSGDTVTASALVNTGAISIYGNGTVQATLNITTGAAGFGTLGVETGTANLTNNALLDFASGQIGTIDGQISLNGANARIADAGTLATNSALTGLTTDAGNFYLTNGASVSTAGGLSVIGSGQLAVDSAYIGGGGGSSLTINGTLTDSSTNGGAVYIGNGSISSNDTVTANGLNNAGDLTIQGNGTTYATLAINGSATNSGNVAIDASGHLVMGAGDAYTQAADSTYIASGGTLVAPTVNITGGVLEGFGTVVGTIDDNGPGAVYGGQYIGTPGTLTIDGGFNVGGSGTLEANIGPGGTSSGVVAVAGGNYVTLTGGTLLLSSTPAVGQLLTVMTFGSGALVGQFAHVKDGAAIGNGSNVNLGDGTTLEVFYNNDSGNIQVERVNTSSLATSYTWIDGTANWSTAADWSGGQVPNSTANVVIGNTATGNVTLNGSSGDTTVNSVTITPSNTLTVSGVTLTSATGGSGISVASGATLLLANNGEINGSVLSGAGLLETLSGTGILADDTISSGTTFVAQNNTTTELLGPIDNAGTIALTGGAGYNSYLSIGNSVTLSGGGTVLLTDLPGGGNDYVTGNNQTLDNTNNLILGTGIIGNGSLALINGGVIDAAPEGTTTTLTLNGSGGVANTGTLEATGGATLVINDTVDNAGGTVTVGDASSTVQLYNASIQGGTLNNLAGGVLDTAGSVTLDGTTQGALTLSKGSTLTASSGTYTTLYGTIANDGTIQVYGGSGQNTLLIAGNSTTLTGGGTVTLNTATGGGSAIIMGNSQTLTSNNTIQGSGIIGNGSLTLINSALIDATPDGGTSTLTLNGSGGVTNTGTLDATGGATLVINTTVDNAGGHITVGDSTSTVQIINATVQGGTLVNSGGGLLTPVGNVTLDGTTQGALTLSKGSTFTAADATNTTLFGTIVNDGTIQMYGGAGQNSVLLAGNSTTLSGGGTVTLNTATGGGFAIIEGNGQTLTTNNTLQGSGIIGNGNLTLINNAVIDATPDGGTSTLSLNGTGGVTNTDLLEATGGAALVISTNVGNTGANITASGTGSTVQIYNSVTITGGTLNTASGGAMETTGVATLQGLTISSGSTYTASNNTSTILLGVIANDGLIQVGGGNGQNGYLSIGNSVTLNGGGTVTLSTKSGGGAAYINGNGQTLTNANNTIQGTGVIGDGNVVLINNGVVDATPESDTSTLTLDGGGVTNTNLLEATNGATLSITTNVTNTGGNITASGGGSLVEFSNGDTITGGILNTTGGGAMGTGSVTTLQGLTISAGSTYTAGNNTTTYLLGVIENDGVIQLDGGSGQNGWLWMSNNVTLTGGGTVMLSTATGSGEAFIGGNGQTLTNAGNTILGTGVIGDGNVVLINNSVIDATPEGGTTSLTLNTSGGVTNTGTLEATNGGTLVLDANVTNTGANIIASGSSSVVQIGSGAIITGGTLTGNSGGALETTPGNSATLQGLTLAAGSTYTSTNNATTELFGTIDNIGTFVQIGGGGGNGVLYIGNSVTLNGGGVVVLSTAPGGGNAFIEGNGNTLTNTNNTILGTGVIGNGNVVLINNGVVDATPEGGSSTLALNTSGGVTNTGTLEATNGGDLVITSNVTNTAAHIIASGSSSLVQIGNGAIITGGTLTTNNAAAMQTAPGNTVTLQGVTISAGSTYTSTNNATTDLVGTIDNIGTLVQAGGNGGNGVLYIANVVTLNGGGTVMLSTAAGGGDAYIVGNGNTLINTNNTILGSGVIGDGNVVLVNGGVIDATSEGGTSTLTLNGGGVTNTGTLEATNGGTLVFGGSTPITENGLVYVDGTSVLDLASELVVNGTLINAGAINGGGATQVAFGSGTDRLILYPGATFGGTVVGGAHTTLELAAGAGAGTLSALGTNFTNFGTVIVDSGATWTVDALSSVLSTTTFTGDNAGSTLALIGAGAIGLGGVSKFGTIDLDAGNNTVTLTDNTLSGGAVTINDGASGNNSVSATGDTSASKGKSLTYVAGSGTDSFTGGFENDTVYVPAAAVGGDTLTGGSGTNTLVLSTAGSANLGGVSKFSTIDLAAGNSTVTITDATLSGGPVTINDGASGNNTVSAAGDTSASKGKSLTYVAGSGTDSFTGGFENDTVKVASASVGGDTLTGGSGTNLLVLTAAGAANLGGVSKFPTIDLAAGNSTVTIGDTTLSGGSVAVHDGASGNNSVSAAGDTSASTGKTLTYYTGSGTDSFTGGFENDTVDVSASAVGGDTLTGGSGTNSVVLTSAGTVNLGGVSKFAGIYLAAGNNTVTLTNTTLSGGTVTVHDGASGNNSVSAAGDTSASAGKSLTFDAGSGTDSFTGGFENDTVNVSAAAFANDTLTGGSGTNTLVLTSAGSINLANVTKFGTVYLATGSNTVTVTDTTLKGGTVALHDGSSGSNTVSAASDTTASKGKSLIYYTGSGTDHFTGGFENDTVDVSAAAVGGDTLTGGSGTNVLVLTSAGTVNLGGVSKFATIDLATGNSTVTVTDTTLSAGSFALHDGASGNNTVNASGDTTASTGKILTYDAGTGIDHFTGGHENDQIYLAAAGVAGDTLTGGSGANTLSFTTAGNVNLSGVSKFISIYLAAGNNTVTLTDTTLSGGSVTFHDLTTGNNTISAAGDTSASKGKSLVFNAGSGVDSFTGGYENDSFYVAAASVGADTLTGGSGSNSLVLTTAGTVNLGGVSKFSSVYLAAGNSTVTIGDTVLSSGAVTLHDGASGNNKVSAASDTSASKGKTLTYYAGTGTDTFTGGFENDTLEVTATAIGGDVLTGGSGTNTLVLTSAGSVALGGVSKFATIDLAAGNSTVTLADATLSAGAVALHDGASGNNSVSAAGDTSASTGKTLTYYAGSGTDSFTGGFENDTVDVSATAVGGDTLTGGSGTNALVLTSAGSANLGGVSKFAAVYLASGNSSVTLTDTTLSAGTVTLHDGGSGNNTVSAAGDTSASTGKTLTYDAGSGTDSFTGGFENDNVFVSAAAVGGDTLTGGSGTNSLYVTSAGAVNLGGVSKFGTVTLAAGNSTVTVTDTTLSGGAVTLHDGASGNNSISAAGDTSASTGDNLVYYAGKGTDSFTGGFENDTIYAGTGLGTYTAGSGTDTFVFIADNLPTQTLDNFQPSTDSILLYGIHASNGFDLGSADNALNPSTPTAITASIFTSSSSGDFTSSTQRFAYNTTNGDLYYSATGSNTSESLVATLTGAPAVTASDLLFEH